VAEPRRTGGLYLDVQFSGEHLLRAPRERVWRLLNDPAALAQAAGFTGLTPAGPDRYAATIPVAMGPMNGAFQGHLELTDKQPAEAMTVKVTARGMGGGLNAVGQLRLHDAGDNTTRVEWSGSPTLSGMLAFASGLLTPEAARTQAERFFALIEQQAADTAGDDTPPRA
jgi:uncharacterized protein